MSVYHNACSVTAIDLSPVKTVTASNGYSASVRTLTIRTESGDLNIYLSAPSADRLKLKVAEEVPALSDAAQLEEVKNRG